MNNGSTKLEQETKHNQCAILKKTPSALLGFIKLKTDSSNSMITLIHDPLISVYFNGHYFSQVELTLQQFPCVFQHHNTNHKLCLFVYTMEYKKQAEVKNSLF